ncbi:MAG: hypothetical protein JWN17_2097 [Frankiales bacterium]|nr:hypothetical protein [Frankiales bacterium]
MRWSRSPAGPGTDPDSPPRRRHARLARAGAAAAVVAVLAVLLGGVAQVRFDTSFSSLFDQGTREGRDYAGVQKSFGAEPITVLVERPGEPKALLKSATLPALLKLEGELAGLDDAAVVYGPATVLNQIAASAQKFIVQVTGTRDGLRQRAVKEAKERGATDAEAAAAGDRALVPFDERYGALLTQGLPAGLPTLRNQNFIDATAYGKDGKPRPELRFVVPDSTSVAILVRPREGLDQDAERRLESQIHGVLRQDPIPGSHVLVTGPAVVLQALAVDVQGQLPLLAVLAVVAVATMLLLGHRRDLRSPRRAARLLVPLLASLGAVLVLTSVLGWADVPATLGLLTLLPVLLGVGTDVPVYLSRLGKDRRLAVAALATGAGFYSTALSPVPFVRGLGLLLGTGVLLAAAIGWFLPAVEPQQRPAAVARTATTPRFPVRTLRALTLVAAVVAAAGWAVLPSIGITSDPASLASGLGALDDAHRAQDRLGAISEIDVLLRGDALSPAALAWSTKAAEAVIVHDADRLKPISSPASLLGFLGPTPTTEQVRSAVQLLPAYLLGVAVAPDGQSSVLSYGLRADDVAGQQDLVDSLRRLLPPPPRDTTVSVTGVPVLASAQLQELERSRVSANVIGVLVPSLVLLLLLGRSRWRDSALAASAAVIATGTGFLLLWTAGIAFTPLTLALGSLTAAVGCEFSVVLGSRQGEDSRRGVLLAAGACLAGYLSLAVSGLDVIRDFGLVLAGSVVLGYASSRLVTAAWVPTGAADGGTARGGVRQADSDPAAHDDGPADARRPSPAMTRSATT